MLQQMREGKDDAWKAFREFYRPLIASCGLDLGLTSAENDSLIQDVLIACFQENVLSNYDHTKGKFRYYLWSVATRKAKAILANRTDDLPPGISA